VACINLFQDKIAFKSKADHPRMCALLVTCSHFQSRDKDDGHTIRSAIVKNTMLHANFSVAEAELLPIEVLYCGNRDFRRCLLPRPWPCPDDLHILTWPVFPEMYRTSDTQIERQNRIKIICYAASRTFNALQVLFQIKN